MDSPPKTHPLRAVQVLLTNQSYSGEQRVNSPALQDIIATLVEHQAMVATLDQCRTWSLEVHAGPGETRLLLHPHLEKRPRPKR